MIKFNAPTSVTRGSEYKGIVEIGEKDLRGARSIEVALTNEITYGKEEKNYSCWKMSKRFSPGDAKSMFELPFEFRVEGEAPVTYRGKQLSSKWKLHVAIDVVGESDRWRNMDVIMLR